MAEVIELNALERRKRQAITDVMLAYNRAIEKGSSQVSAAALEELKKLEQAEAEGWLSEFLSNRGF